MDTSVGEFDVSGIRCAGGFQDDSGRTGAASVATAGSCEYKLEPYVLGGCNAIVCTRPNPLTVGFDFAAVSEVNLDLSVGEFNVGGVRCAVGYQDSLGRIGAESALGVTITACTSSGNYSVSGCFIVCSRPSAGSTTPPNGYDFQSGVVTEQMTLGLLGNPFIVSGIRCANGFEGGRGEIGTDSAASVIVTPCATSGPYILSGCKPVICDRPELNFAVGYDFAAVSEVNLDLGAAEFNVGGVRCAVGYQDFLGRIGAESALGVTITACTSSENYSVSGCRAIVCARPAGVLKAYSFQSVLESNLDLSQGAFSVTGIRCSAGYQDAFGRTNSSSVATVS